MRCLRTTAETPIDPRLISLLYRISQRTGQKIILVSGFRAPMFSLATLSYHTRGMAADIRIPGMTPLMVRDLAAVDGREGDWLLPGLRLRSRRRARPAHDLDDYGRDRQDTKGRSTVRSTASRSSASPKTARSCKQTSAPDQRRFTQREFSARSRVNAVGGGRSFWARSAATYSPAAWQASPWPLKRVSEPLRRPGEIAGELRGEAVQIGLHRVVDPRQSPAGGAVARPAGSGRAAEIAVAPARRPDRDRPAPRPAPRRRPPPAPARAMQQRGLRIGGPWAGRKRAGAPASERHRRRRPGERRRLRRRPPPGPRPAAPPPDRRRRAARATARRGPADAARPG